MGNVAVRSIIQPFYRQNGGLLAFLFFIMVLSVGRANEAGLLEYHLSLIQGMLTTAAFFLFVLGAWLLYAWKCAQFVERLLMRPEFSFLYLLAQVDRMRVYRVLLRVQVILFLPVLSYAGIVLWVGYRHHWYAGSMGVLVFNLGVCLGAAYRYMVLVGDPGKVRSTRRWMLLLPATRSYSGFLIRYVLTRRKLLFLGIKLYSCWILYFALSGRSLSETDLSMGLLFYSTGVLGHGILIYLLKEMEESRLAFYRGLPVPALQRLIQYGAFYLFLLIPEMVIGAILLPVSMAVSLFCFSYSLLLLLNSLRLVGFDRKIDFLKMVTGLFLLIIIAVMTGVTGWFTLLCFFSAVGVFLPASARHK